MAGPHGLCHGDLPSRDQKVLRVCHGLPTGWHKGDEFLHPWARFIDWRVENCRLPGQFRKARLLPQFPVQILELGWDKGAVELFG